MFSCYASISKKIIAEICPQIISVYGNRSAVYLMLGQPKLALEDAKTAISLDPNFIKGWNRVARCSVLLGDILAAKRAVSHLLRLGEDTSLEGNNIESLEKFEVLTMQAIHEKDYRKAVWSIDKALEMATHCVKLKICRAECLAFLGRCEEASEVAVSILQVDNKNVDAMYVRGLCLYYEDDIDKALSFLSTVLKYAPDHSKAMNRFKVLSLVHISNFCDSNKKIFIISFVSIITSRFSFRLLKH